MDLNSLLQQAQKLSNETQLENDELPRVERTIAQVLQATQELHTRVTQCGTQDIQAHIFLGSKGIDLPKISQKLDALNARKTFEPLDPVVESDVQTFLRNERENAVLSVIEEVHKNSYEEAQKRKWEYVKLEWRKEKTKLLNALVGPSQSFIDLQKAPEQTILNQTSNRNSILNHIEMAYAHEVGEYNDVVIKGGMRPNLVHKFAALSAKFDDPKVKEIWQIMKYMVDIVPLSRTRDPLQSRNEVSEFVVQAKKYLENRYKLYMTSFVCSNLREAARGGVPSTYNLVTSFVGITFNYNNTIGLEDSHIENKPLWPMVYYCLRCGDIKAALRCMEMARAGNEDFIQALKERERKADLINPKLEQQLKMHYFNKIKNSTDPFKKAAYCILGSCDINEQHAEVAKTTDDFLWIQLSMLRPESRDNSESLTYSSLQTMVLEKYGEKHFNANEQRHLYFQVLALTGQFEAAIEFLSRTERYRTHAVHVALALNELYLIGTPRNVQQPMLSVDIDDPVPMRRLNVARLIMLYVKKFEITDPGEALQYYFFLRNLKDPEGRNVFLVCVADLAVESRAYDLLFGTLQPNGLVSGGLFERFDSVEFDTRNATRMVAEELVRKGMFEDAIQLFDMAGNHTQALHYLSMLLSQLVHQRPSQDSLRDRLALKAAEFNDRLRGNRVDCDDQVINTFSMLHNLVDFFDLYHDGKYQAALDKAEESKFVPRSFEDIDDCINHSKQLTGEILKVVPSVLLAAMDILYTKFKSLKGVEKANIDGEAILLKHIREKAKAITNMAALVPYRMPGDTNKRLVQIEILMN